MSLNLGDLVGANVGIHVQYGASGVGCSRQRRLLTTQEPREKSGECIWNDLQEDGEGRLVHLFGKARMSNVLCIHVIYLYIYM